MAARLARAHTCAQRRGDALCPVVIGNDGHSRGNGVTQGGVAHDNNRVVESGSERDVEGPRRQRAAAEGREKLWTRREPASATRGKDDCGGGHRLSAMTCLP